MNSKAKLKGIKSSVLSRSLALSKTTLSMGAQLAGHAIDGMFSEKEKSERVKALLSSQMEILAKDLGQLKGSLMKAGQMLSMYAEYFMPPEAAEILRSLQSQSPALDWNKIKVVLEKELGTEKISRLEIEEEPIGAASLGQVHRARIRGTDTYITLKIQYPGVDKAIESDLNALRRLLSLTKLIPKEMPTDHIFNEIRSMLKQEVDYLKEAELTMMFREKLKGDQRFIVPTVFNEFSSQRVIATSYEMGQPVLSHDVLSLSQSRRDKLGCAITELYLKELYEYRMVQTDPHFGNYLVRIDLNGEDDKLVLLDFGATKLFEGPFLDHYRAMAEGSVTVDRSKIINASEKMGFLKPDDDPELVNKFVALCYEVSEPFMLPGQYTAHPELMDSKGNYDWARSDLPSRLARKGTQVAFASRFRPPPQEVVFIDRKMTGLFIFLQKLKCRFNARKLFEPYLS